MALEKAKFINHDDGESITVHFNPSSLSISSNAIVSEIKTQQTDSDSVAINAGGIKNRQLHVSLIFNSFIDISDKSSVSFKVSSAISSLFGADDNQPDNVKDIISKFEEFMNSPNISFVWGKIIFTGIIENMSTQYTMFDTDGTPVRANVELDIQEIEDAQLFQSDFFDNDFDLDDSDSEEDFISNILGGIKNLFS